MVVEWSHLKDPLASELKGAHLQNHRERLHHKNSADEGQQQFLLDDHSHRGDGPAQSQGTDIAHENLRRIRVVPQESKARPHHGATENRQLRHQREVLDREIIRPSRISRHVSQRRQGRGRNQHAPDRQTVQPVCQVDGVRRTYQDQDDEGQKRQIGQRISPGVAEEPRNQEVRV